jgi:hypothetical protein
MTAARAPEKTILAQRLAALEDVNAIQALKWRYLRACDRKQPDLVRDCFTPEAVIDFEGFPLFTDREAFVEVYRRFGCQPHIVDMHHGQNPIVELIDADHARGWFDCFFFQIDTDSRRLTQLAVSYDDGFVRRDGRWLIARSVSRRISMLVQELGEDALARVRVAGRSDIAGPPAPPRA